MGAGNYIDSTGNVLGMHQGYCNYTIGQRKGLGIALGSPKFVTKIDAEKNCVTLGEREELFAQEVCATNIRIRDLAWLEDSPEVEARIRYKSPAAKGVINFDLGIKDFEFNTLNSKLTIHFSTPVWGVTPGQSLVLYKDGLVVGGGFIYLP